MGSPAVPSGDEVAYEKVDQVALLTFNRPQSLNAFTPSMHAQYRTLLAAAEADGTVRAIVVTGAGSAFCAGADTTSVRNVAENGTYPTGDKPKVDARPGYGVHPAFDRPLVYHFGLTKPVIAAINGPAIGMGFVLACCADIRLLAHGASCSAGFARLGLPVEFGLSWILPRLIGLSRAAEVLLSDRQINSDEAVTMGLASRALEPGQLVPQALAMGADIAKTCAPTALREAKRQIYMDLFRDLESAYGDASTLVKRMVAEPAFREAVAARTEHRTPDFRPSRSDGSEPISR